MKFINKLLIKLLILIISCIGLLSLLFYTAELPNENKNGFNRKLRFRIEPVHFYNTKAPLKKIVGFTPYNIFFSVPNPMKLIMIDSKLTNQDTFNFNIPKTQSPIASANMTVDSPLIYLPLNNENKLIYGPINSQNVKITKLPTSIFTKSTQISRRLMLVRAFDTIENVQIFKQIDLLTGKTIRQAKIIEDQRDGGFSTDGLLRYDNKTKRIIFLQFYQNRFFCLDTNLNVIFEGKTIDTSKTAEVIFKKVKKDEEIKLMPANSRQIINKDCFLGNGYIFIVSGLKADNESYENFKNNSPIDVYNITDGMYEGSFYLPVFKKKQIKSIALLPNNNIVVLVEGYVLTYRLLIK